MQQLVSQFPTFHGVAIGFLITLVVALALWPQPSNSIQVSISLPEISLVAPESESQQVPEISIKELEVSSGDSLSVLFEKAEVSPGTLFTLLSEKENKQTLRAIRPGESVKFYKDSNQELVRFDYVLSAMQTESFEFVDGKFNHKTLTKEPEYRTRFSEAVIDSSLFLSGKQAGLSETIIMEMAQIFAWDVDFALDIRKGDKFSMIYQEKYLEGEKLGYGPILAAQFVNNGNVYTAIRYTDSKGETGFYTPDGHSMRKAFLRTPLDYTRISSHFNPKRKHPVLNKIRAHKGTDYAAPSGTPIKAAGDGKITFAGRKGGYGNTVEIQHGQTYSTLYGHMKGFHRSIRKGKTVKQGQVIGYVGSTGLSTGPHLHYEFRVNGVHRNPVTVKLPDATPVPEAIREDFLAHAANMQGQLAVYQTNAFAAINMVE